MPVRKLSLVLRRYDLCVEGLQISLEKMNDARAVLFFVTTAAGSGNDHVYGLRSEPWRNFETGNMDIVQAVKFTALGTAKMNVFVVMLMFGTFLRAGGVVGSPVQVDYTMYNAFLLKRIQNAVKRYPVDLAAEQGFQVGLAGCFLF